MKMATKGILIRENQRELRLCPGQMTSQGHQNFVSACFTEGTPCSICSFSAPGAVTPFFAADALQGLQFVFLQCAVSTGQRVFYNRWSSCGYRELLTQQQIAFSVIICQNDRQSSDFPSLLKKILSTSESIVNVAFVSNNIFMSCRSYSASSSLFWSLDLRYSNTDVLN